MRFGLLLIFTLFHWSNGLFAQSNAPGRIESEYKLSVPNEEVEKLWQFLQQNYQDNILALDSNFTASTAEEVFYDQYFDTEEEILFQNKSGARYRERYLKDSLLKKIFQLKLPTADTTGLARTEIKFSVYEKVKKQDRLAMHPFWKYIRPKNRDDVNLHLAAFGIKGDQLFPALKVKQVRKRIYMLENKEPFMTITLDKVSHFHFPYTHFTELELELNEIRYTDGTPLEKQRMELLNKKIKQQISQAFPMLVQNQTPKYNKMKLLLEGNVLLWFYDNFLYLILGGFVLYAIYLYLKVSN